MSTSLQLLTSVLDELPLGVVVVDRLGRVVVFNKAEEHLARRNRSDVLGRLFFSEVAPCMRVKELGGLFEERMGKSQFEARIEFSFPFPFLPQPRDVVVNLRSFEIDGEPYALMLIEDVSAARAVTRMQHTLTQMLLHDLKNPLAVIQASAEFVRNEMLAEQSELREALNDALDANKRLQRMLLNLLDISRLETNSLPVRPQPTDAQQFLESIRAQTHMLNRRVAVTVAAGPPVRLSLDPELMTRAMLNVVENSVRFARSFVTMAASKQEHHVVFEISDDGPGVPVELRANLFQKFQTTAHAAHNRGMGLTFVRLACRAHGGEATAECPPDGGTVFRLSVAAGAASVSARHESGAVDPSGAAEGSVRRQ